jgi:hypothetical protein
MADTMTVPDTVAGAVIETIGGLVSPLPPTSLRLVGGLGAWAADRTMDSDAQAKAIHGAPIAAKKSRRVAGPGVIKV